MIRKSISTSLMICLLLVWSLSGCALLQTALSTPEKKYLAARMEYNKQLTTYVQKFQVQDQATKDVWKEKYSPVFKTADSVLDAWSLLLGGTLPTADNEQEWLDMKNKLIDVINDLTTK